jgi:hypothetical protein
VAVEIPPLALLALVNVLVWTMIALETRHHGESRARIRDDPEAEPPT